MNRTSRGKKMQIGLLPCIGRGSTAILEPAVRPSARGRCYAWGVEMPSHPTAGALQSADFGRLLRDARRGSLKALGQVLEGCRMYLLLVANEEFDLDLKDKLGPSDVVQETFLDAQRDFSQFAGTTDR